MLNEIPAAIPRIIHQIWLGGPVPTEVQGWMESWKRHHPDWEYRLWTDANIPTMDNDSQYNAASAYAVKADLARVEILRLHGGVYVDADYECFRPIDPLIASNSVVVLSEGDGSITNSLVATVPAHPLLEKLVSEMSMIDPQKMAVPSFDPLPWTGPRLWTRVISEAGFVFAEGFSLLPPDFFVTPKTRVSELIVMSESRRYGTHHAMATWRPEGGLLNRIRRTRLRTRIRRFLDLSAA